MLCDINVEKRCTVQCTPSEQLSEFERTDETKIKSGIPKNITCGGKKMDHLTRRTQIYRSKAHEASVIPDGSWYTKLDSGKKKFWQFYFAKSDPSNQASNDVK
jgi:hypothetical protein